MSSDEYLNPDSYERASLWLKLLFYIGHHFRYALSFAFIGVLAIVDYFLLGGWEIAISVSIVLGFLLFQSYVPRELLSDTEEYVSHGTPIPNQFRELGEWLKEAFVPASVAAGIGLALVVYGWSAPSGSAFQMGLTAMFAFLTNVCIMSSVTSYSWGRMLDGIVKGKGSRFGGIGILGPTLLVAGATAVISFYSGLSQLEDSICTFMPPIVIGVYVVAATQTGGFVEPFQERKRVLELREKEDGFRRRIEWLTAQRASYARKEYQTELEGLNSEVFQAERIRKLHEESLTDYDILVGKVIGLTRKYQARRLERDGLLQAQSSQIIGEDAKSKMTEALGLVAAVPAKPPPSYIGTRQFKFYRQACTVMDFPIILSSHGLYLPSVSSVKALELSAKLDKSTFETYAPASFEYFMRVYESAEIAHLWHFLKTKESFIHCYRFVSEYVGTIAAFVDASGLRSAQFEGISEVDPKAKVADLMETVRGPGPSLNTGIKIASARLEGAKSALQLILTYQF